MLRFFHKPSAKILVLHACLILAGLQIAGCSSREERAKDYYEHGMSYLQKKDFVKARIEFRNAIQLKGDMVAAWRGLAQIDEHDRNMKALAGSLRRIVELDDKDVKTRVRLAKLYLLGGAVQEALKLTNAAVEIEPQNATVLALKAAVLFRLKDNDGAALQAQKALKIDPNSVDALVVLAASKFMQGDSDGALQTLQNVTDAHKEDLGVLFLKINIYNRQGKLHEVETLLRRLVALHPKEPVFRTKLIQFYVANKRSDDAEKELRTIIAANPNDVRAELELVKLLAALKGPSAARTELVSRINAGGNVFPYQITLAKLDFSQGKTADSTDLLEKLIRDSKSPNDVLSARIALAKIYVSKKNFAAAEPLISEILSVDSRNIEGLRLRASILLERGKIDDAIVDLRRALNDQPRSPELLVTIGIAYERSGAIELADKAFFDANKASNFAPAFGLNYVAFLRRRGMTDHADSVLNDLATRHPNNIAVLTELAKAKLARQDWVGAHQVADAIKKLGDTHDISDQLHAAAFGGENKLDNSLALLQDAYNANPNAIQPMAALVTTYLRTKQPDKAEAFLQSVLKANPDNGEALVLLGSVQLANNKQKQAANYYEQAIEKQPKNSAGYRALADLYIRQNKIDDALKTVRAGIRQRPKDFALRLTLAGLLEKTGDYERAIMEYESMLKDQPGSMIIANNLASLLSDHRKDKASLERARSLALLLRNSPLPQFKDTVGWIDYQQGDYRAAIASLKDAATQMANVALVHYHLGMSYLAIGETAKASQEFKKARELAPNDAELKSKIDAALSDRPRNNKG